MKARFPVKFGMSEPGGRYLRGRFDYASLSTDDMARVERFALLALSETHGASVRDVEPPKR